MVALAVSERLRFADRATNLLDRVDYRLADLPEEKEAIYRLRYSAYLREGAIDAHFSRRFADEFDESPNVQCFGVYIDGRLASSMRLHIATRDCPVMPAMRPFPDFLESELAAGKTIIDPTRFVTDLDASRAYPELPYATIRLALAASEFYGADLLLATVRKEHQAFYRRVLGHELICEVRPYPTLKKPLSLMSLAYQQERHTVLARYPFFHTTAFERRMLFGRAPVAHRQAA